MPCRRDLWVPVAYSPQGVEIAWFCVCGGVHHSNDWMARKAARPMIFTLSISPDRLDSARSRLRAQGIPVPESDTGSLEAKGVLLEYAYSSGILTVKIARKPAMVLESYVERTVREWFK